MTQYDALGSLYDVMESLPFKALEEHNVLLAILPFLKYDTAVLDFACGTGYDCSRLLSWGATSVTGMDISSSMLSAASVRLSTQISSGRARLVLADGKEPQSYAPDDSSNFFDLAFGAWFLNYAQNKAELTTMFSNIALSLKPGGVFESKPAEYAKELDSGEGWDLQVFLNDNRVNFSTWHLKKKVYEQAAREGGMKGKLEWRREVFPGNDWKRTYGLTGEDEWKVREEHPYLGIMVVRTD
ncbi:hypothetical protein F1880_007267 [Penicillium rolfsii]|nr:hypothetical protein F1880_007267 [Penicillium rolfsii]